MWIKARRSPFSILFSIFCNDLPEVVVDDEGQIEMYADDTTLYVAARNQDEVAGKLNKTLEKLYEWCCLDGLSPHLGKTEYMILGRGKFAGPLQDIKFGNSSIKQVLVF